MSRLNHPSIIKFVGYSPIDFENLSQPIFITENFYEISIPKDDTKKLIRIYGIASAMAYLHSHNIIHRNLKSENIVGNTKYGLPKIYGFDIAKEINDNSIKPNKTIKGPPIYIAPEIYLYKGYSKKSDVYAFALIVYEIMTGKKPFDDLSNPKEIKKKVVDENERPKFEKPILNCYKELIEKCWAADPNLRPSFTDILTELKTNSEFITDTVDKELFLEYVAYIDEFNITYEPDRKVKQLDDILENKLHSYLDIRPSIHFKNMCDTEKNNLIIDDDFYLNLDDFDFSSIKEKDGNFYKVEIVQKNNSKLLYAKKHPFYEPEYFLKHDIINFARELNILLQLNHPSILKFFGYGLYYHEEPNIFVEYLSNGSLGRILKLEREKNRKSKSHTNSYSSSDNDDENKEQTHNMNAESKIDDENEEDKIDDENEEDKIDDENEEDKIDDENEEDKIDNENEEDKIDNENEEDKIDDENEEDKIDNENEEDKIDNENEEDKIDDENEEDKIDDENEEDKIDDENENNSKEEEEDKNNSEEEEEEETDDDDESEEENNEEEEDTNIFLDDTDKLIIIYGIAAGMLYLHSHNILHRDLKPYNIYLNDHLYPKISGFNISKEATNDFDEANITIKGTPVYVAPEVYLNKGYCKKSDVYAFSLIVYEIISGERPYEKYLSPKEIKKKVVEDNERPKFKTPILNCYKELIEKCWSTDPNLRPTFAEILNELKTNPEFITNTVDEEKYKSYIKFIEDYPISFESSRKIDHLEDFVKNKLYKFNEANCKINFRSIFETETNNICTEYDYTRINKYEKQKLIRNYGARNYSKLYLINSKKTKKLYTAHKDLKFQDKDDPYRYIDLSREINNILKIKHPLFLRFLKYSPTDFKNHSNPTFIFEYASNDSLDRMIEVNRRKKGEPVLNDTKKLILIFGIAAAMSYLHSINIIHCCLNPSNILLDDFLFPKITGLDYSKNLLENPIVPLCDLVEGEYSGYEDYNIYNAPELMNCFMYSSACDVYSFAIITYELITDEIPFQDGRSDDGYRPGFKETTPNCYKTLIEKCWNQDPKERPTFEEIVNHMKSNQEFITENVDKEEFLNFVRFTEEIHDKSINNEIFELDNFIQTQNERFRKIKINYNKLRDWLRINLTVNIGASDLNKYSKMKKLGNGSFGNVYKVLDKQNNIVYAAKISIYEMDQCSEDTIMNLSREIDIISSIKYPSILQFIGFCPKNFKGKPKPVIITKFASNGSLGDILENERKGLGNPNWNDTKKLINIYGIAAGMDYLNNRDIIHRDLKPDNILLDENLYPKIADFGMSKNNNEETKSKKHIISGFKGTYAYAAPEVIDKYEYSTFGDVYSFAFIMYEIMTNEKPFADINNIFQLLIAIKNGVRPKFNVQIPYCYKNLIQKCWNEDQYSRPDFSKICSILRNDPNFITANVDNDEYLNYINYLNESQNDSNTNEETNEIKSTTSSINLEHIDETKEEEHINCILDLNKYQTEEVIFKKDTFKICKVRDIETNNEFGAYMSMLKVKSISKDDIENLSNDLKIISQFKHPSLLKFIGFSLIDFKKQRKPVIITEFATNGVLEQILELEKMNKKISGWDNTKKLINIYGIASGMAYMHSHGIIHRCLSPSNVYLDDILCPKIGDFGLIARFTDANNMTHQSMSGAKGTPIYSAPEVLEFNKYTKSSDVYSFSLLIYEILTNEKPFNEINNTSQIYNKIVIKGERPVIKKDIPVKYKELIEKCWAQDPNERPEFKDIVYLLKIDKEFITDEINKEDYEKYINFIDSIIMNEANQKREENDNSKLKESETEINTNKTNIEDKIYEEQTELNTKIETNIEDKINEEQTKLDTKIETYKTNNEYKINEEQTKLDTKIETNKTNIEDKIMKNNQN